MKYIEVIPVGPLWVAVGPDFRAAGTLDAVTRTIYNKNYIPLVSYESKL